MLHGLEVTDLPEEEYKTLLKETIEMNSLEDIKSMIAGN
jgi:hypothetical protein